MKKDKLFKKYLFFMLCSALVVGAATFYFHVSDIKKNTTTIIIDHNTEEITAPASTSAPKTTSKKIPKATKTTSLPNKSHTATQTESATEFIFLDINSASSEELMKLHGIGAVTAEEIVRYRIENDRFDNIEEIMNVKGIGEKVFEEIREHIYVIDPIYETPTEIVTNEEITEPDSETSLTLEELAPIDINTADAEILAMLPHVDEEITGKIIEFREKNSGFKNEYELLMIDGLSRSEVSEIIEYIEIK